ncbi:Uncharacterised protein [Mycobacterium tuberculosis]|nr:Uncharacterised protein [Mycobacterium tuberculosis]
MKYSSTVRPSRNEDLTGRGMNSPFGLVTRPFMPASVRVWVKLPVAPESTIVMIGLLTG